MTRIKGSVPDLRIRMRPLPAIASVFAAITARTDVQKALDSFKNGAMERLNAMMKTALDRTSTPATEDDGWPTETGEMAT